MRKLTDIGGIVGLAGAFAYVSVEVGGRHGPPRIDPEGREPLDRVLLQHEMTKQHVGTLRGRLWALRERLHGRPGVAA